MEGDNTSGAISQSSSSSKRYRRSTSSVWTVFNKLPVDSKGRQRATCKFCKQEYVSDAGTSSLRRHALTCTERNLNEHPLLDDEVRSVHTPIAHRGRTGSAERAARGIDTAHEKNVGFEKDGHAEVIDTSRRASVGSKGVAATSSGDSELAEFGGGGGSSPLRLTGPAAGPAATDRVRAMEISDPLFRVSWREDGAAVLEPTDHGDQILVDPRELFEDLSKVAKPTLLALFRHRPSTFRRMPELTPPFRAFVLEQLAKEVDGMKAIRLGELSQTQMNKFKSIFADFSNNKLDIGWLLERWESRVASMRVHHEKVGRIEAAKRRVAELKAEIVAAEKSLAEEWASLSTSLEFDPRGSLVDGII